MDYLYYLPEALFWKYGPVADTAGNSITAWQHKDLPQPSEEELIKLCEEYYTKTSYASRRSKEYPTITEQLDALYHEGYEGWKTKIKEIKDKYPKPE